MAALSIEAQISSAITPAASYLFVDCLLNRIFTVNMRQALNMILGLAARKLPCADIPNIALSQIEQIREEKKYFRFEAYTSIRLYHCYERPAKGPPYHSYAKFVSSKEN